MLIIVYRTYTFKVRLCRRRIISTWQLSLSHECIHPDNSGKVVEKSA